MKSISSKIFLVVMFTLGCIPLFAQNTFTVGGYSIALDTGFPPSSYKSNDTIYVNYCKSQFSFTVSPYTNDISVTGSKIIQYPSGNKFTIIGTGIILLKKGNQTIATFSANFINNTLDYKAVLVDKSGREFNKIVSINNVSQSDLAPAIKNTKTGVINICSGSNGIIWNTRANQFSTYSGLQPGDSVRVEFMPSDCLPTMVCDQEFYSGFYKIVSNPLTTESNSSSTTTISIGADGTKLYVYSGLSLDNAQIKITDSSGNILVSLTQSGNVISIQSLPQGSYFLDLKFKSGESFIKRFIK